MKIYKSYKFRIYPNKNQKEIFERYFIDFNRLENDCRRKRKVNTRIK